MRTGFLLAGWRLLDVCLEPVYCVKSTKTAKAGANRMEYQYPIDHTWSTDEIVDVIHFYTLIEAAYEKGVDREDLMKAYRRFKEIVPGKADEKNILDEFQDVSGYSSYLTIKKAKGAEEGSRIKMK